ncbi:Uu.00g108640.m01.CDS01 [Anthostomella pinea]|uniref:Uu.00g108640.m01.CDS01 n=1 Tax=Anthostomella pinea TaxID=933095 RepID=A0AAI8V9F0_9PEZI|nr:Uu.00g108640.m01.CDS01 [Anthostomella pinea]
MARDLNAMSATRGDVQLQSKDHKDLLDIIDKLRSQGISRYVDLPQIIVCGDQSSGKSSVLEAISGMSFPTKDNLCTRFATELILRRSTDPGVIAHIIPGAERSGEEKKRLEAFEYKLDDLDIGQVVEDAKEVMGLNGNNKVFSSDILRVEISGPSQPHLTMVDLPGLFMAGNKDQSEEDAQLVKSLVLSYMEKPRSIILAVVSAKNDFALQQVTQHTRAVDPKGVRTLGLITKPDALDEGSDSEGFFINMAQNKDVKFRLGWHVLRNRSYVERNATSSERDEKESEFFSKGVWTTLESSQLGVSALRMRLSKVLRDQIMLQLPSVLEDVEAGIKQCQDKIAKLGASRGSLQEQRRHLVSVSTGFTSLMKDAIDGNYTDTFFADKEDVDAYPRRLRAVVQNTLSDFAEEMRREGHARIILDGPKTDRDGPRCISRSDYLEEVKVAMRRSRGRELPGSYNPLIVAELFSKQCKPWQNLVGNLAERIVDSVYTTVNVTLQHVADDETTVSLLRNVVDPSVESLKGALATKVEEILRPHLSGHPITYNHYLTDNMQKQLAARTRVALEKRLKKFLRTHELYTGTREYLFNVYSLMDIIVSVTEPNMDTYSCDKAANDMRAYYKVALKTLIDDVSVLAVERCLIQKLPELFSPEVVCNFTDEEIHCFAAESEMSAAERMRATEKLSVLELGQAQLKRLRKHSPLMVESPRGYYARDAVVKHSNVLVSPVESEPESGPEWEPEPPKLEPPVPESPEPELETDQASIVAEPSVEPCGEEYSGPPEPAASVDLYKCLGEIQEPTSKIKKKKAKAKREQKPSFIVDE